MLIYNLKKIYPKLYFKIISVFILFVTKPFSDLEWSINVFNISIVVEEDLFMKKWKWKLTNGYESFQILLKNGITSVLYRQNM